MLSFVAYYEKIKWEKTSLRTDISVHFFGLFSILPGKSVYVIDECCYGMVDICDALAGGGEMFLWSVQARTLLRLITYRHNYANRIGIDHSIQDISQNNK